MVLSLTSQNILCPGGYGSIDLTVSSIPPGYNYQWDNGMQTEDIGGLSIGAYQVFVSDANGCTDSINTSIIQTLSTIPVQIINLTGTSTLDYNVPIIDVQVTGGVSYLWNGGLTPNQANNSFDSAGVYNVNVVDPNGCNLTQTITISVDTVSPVVNLINLSGTNLITCTNQQVTVVAQGGGSYLWSNGGTSSTEFITQPGNYTVSVTSPNGCSSIDSILIIDSINPPNGLITNNSGTTISDCNNIPIDVIASGGVSYLWNGGQTPNDASNILDTLGVYFVLMAVAMDVLILNL